MLRIDYQDLSGRYLLEWMPLHRARRAANVGGRSGALYGALRHFAVERVFGGPFEEAIRWCACLAMEGGYCLLVHARLCNVQRILLHRMCG